MSPSSEFVILKDAAATHAMGDTIARLLQVGDVVTLSGPLGAGKTALARGLLQGLGYPGEVPSPSFPIALPYAPPDVRLPLTHVDLYRIENAGELVELGLEEALIDGALVAEWPERAALPLWSGALALTLTPISDGGRRLTWTAGPAWEGRWPPTRPE